MRNPYDKSGTRTPGGSSAGSAVAVAGAMAFAALGNDAAAELLTDELHEYDYAADLCGVRAIAQALLDSQVLENAVAAAFGAREKALEAQHAAMTALNLPSAGDVERLERRLRSLSQRLDEVEDEIDRVGREIGAVRRQLAADRRAEAESAAIDSKD